MKIVLAVYCIAAVCVIAGLLVLWIRRIREERRAPWREALAERYTRGLLQALVSGAEQVPGFIQISKPGARIVLARELSGVVAATYGLNADLIRKIVIHYELDELLLRRARRSSGYTRAYYLSLLAALPARSQVVEKVKAWRGARNRFVRFYVALVRITAKPETAMQLIGEYPDLFSAFAVSELTTLLRRGMLPVAYEPLVESPNRNLCAVGLSVVRQFGIEEAVPSLLQIAARDNAPELSREAIYTLCSLKQPLARREVARGISRMSSCGRRALLRYMALEGYTPQGLERLFKPAELAYMESLVESYKRSLICS